MTRERRPSAQTVAVLQALAEEPHRWRYGYDLCTQLGVQAGSMYPILMRLADRGLLETSWETERAPGRPPRHLYRLTGTGRSYAASAAPEASATQASAAQARAAHAPAKQSPAAPEPKRGSKTRPRLADA
jgi:PadR family transcriptional regulator, regulatory protein PadR